MTETMQAWKTLGAAHNVLRGAVVGIPVTGHSNSTPCSEWNVDQVIEHAALDQLLYVSALTGAAKPGADAFSPTGNVTDSAMTFLENALTASQSAFAGVDEQAENVSVPLPPFQLPARLAVGAAALDSAVHGWDIAQSYGKSVSFGDDLAEELLFVARQLVEPLRQWGAYGPVVETSADANSTEVLLGFLGRRIS